MSFKIAGPALGYSQMEFKDHGCNGPAADMLGLPGGFPAVLNTESSWTGQDFSLDPHKYIVNLSAANIKELENALETFKNSGQDGGNVTRDTFKLPVLGDTLCQVSQDVISGRGFAVSTLPTSKEDKTRRATCLVSVYWNYRAVIGISGCGD
ncbi:conserved hypothetical protein [Verticillium alfalfae VaMs.102]|uniref:Uncharacterized protein n=1 Tax=Verticillium alfalfae (strain VaMs.102 / ATCC MYA-4576 / FGSC 10136) TaxID=526221 RepID=C9SM81_VERA1|nr:conserved hypothetical protein [Verticillium alfalfae VaMs.102]EEY19896.1 conserved hypothetical protein [Verticillium alfalfae VaMs.102]